MTFLADWIKKNKVLLFSIMVCTWMMIVMVHYSGKSLWGDSIGTIFIANPIHSIWETLKIDITEDVFVAPLFYLTANTWLKIAPYGTKWVKLICEIFVCIGIIFSAQAAKNLFGEPEGFLTALFLSICPYLATQGGYQFRCYGMWFMFTAILIWFHERKTKAPTRGNLIGYGMAAILSCYTHFNGVILFFTFFLWDLFQWFREKITIRHISSYLLWGVLFFPYLVFAYFSVTQKTASFLPSPSAADLFRIDIQILIEPFLVVIFYAALIWAIYRSIRKDQNTAFILWGFAGYKIITFLYSVLNQGYSMWLNRYFICQLPAMMILCACFAADMVKRVYIRRKAAAAAGCAVLLVSFACLEALFIKDLREHRYPEIIHQPFEQTAEILRQQDDFMAPDTAFYYSASNIEAWQYYLAHGDMTPGLLNLLHKRLVNTDLSPYKVIYVCELQDAIPQDVWETFNRLYNIEELHHDYHLYRLTRKLPAE